MLFHLVGWDRNFLSVAWPSGAQLVFFFCSRFSAMLFGAQGSALPGSLSNLCVLAFDFIHYGGYHNIFECP